MDMSNMVSSTLTPAASTAMNMAAGPGSTSMPGTVAGGVHMSGMDMGGSCKISMTWNWYTVGACFIADTWQVKSAGMFAGSCIGVICLVISFESLRRIQRDYERSLKSRSLSRNRDHGSNRTLDTADDVLESDALKDRTEITTVRLPRSHSAMLSRSRLLRRQLIRSLLHMVQFGVAYFIMLLAMYFNGYIIISILIGAFLGSFIFTWDQLRTTTEPAAEVEITGCCG